MRYKRLLPWLALAAILFGCIPKRYEWSPDGRWMTVISDDGLSFADADGKLLPGMIKGVGLATWFGDSKRVLVCRQIDVATWEELARYLTPAQSKAIADAAQHVRDTAMTYDWQNADPKNAWESLATSVTTEEQNARRDFGIYQTMGLAIGVYLRDHPDAELQQKVPPQHWKELVDLTQPVNSIEVYALDSGGPKLSATLMTTLWDVRELRVSPTGNAAIIVTKGQAANSWASEDQACDLWLAATDRMRPAVKIASLAAWYPDWSPDGRVVFFVRTIDSHSEKQATLGSLSRIRVIGDDGKFLNSLKAPEDLVGLLYSEFSRVRCLKDGRILFATVEVTLPATQGDMPEQPQLYAFDPGKQATVNRLFSKQTAEEFGNNAQYFEVSPDEARVSIPDGTGRVTVVELDSGAVMAVQDKPVLIDNDKGTLMTVPAWRTPDELTFAAPGAAKGSPNIVLWSISKNSGKTLSTGWPASFTRENPASTQP